jgi:hypothetical protein
MLFNYTDRLTCLRFTPQNGAISLQTKTIQLCSFLKTERINGSDILLWYKWTL